MIAAWFLVLASTAPDALQIERAVSSPCDAGDQAAIVICGSREKERRYRLPPLPQTYAQRKIRAEASLGAGVKARIHLTSVEIATREKSNRLLLTIGVGF